MHMVFQSAADQQISVIGTYIDVALEEASSVPVENATLAERKFRPRRGYYPRQEGNTTAPPAAPSASVPTTLLETVFASVGDIATPGTVTKVPGPLLLSEIVDIWRAGSFQGYMGSLTTPPCSEGVNWIVSTQTLRIKPSTFERVRDVIGFNSRFTQNAPGDTNVLELFALQTLAFAGSR